MSARDNRRRTALRRKRLANWRKKPKAVWPRLVKECLQIGWTPRFPIPYPISFPVALDSPDGSSYIAFGAPNYKYLAIVLKRHRSILNEQ